MTNNSVDVDGFLAELSELSRKYGIGLTTKDDHVEPFIMEPEDHLADYICDEAGQLARFER